MVFVWNLDFGSWKLNREAKALLIVSSNIIQ
jgi:hypothetical protein